VQTGQFRQESIALRQIWSLSKCGQEVTMVLVVVGNAGGPRPGRHGSSSGGEENARQQERQLSAVSGVQSRRQPLAPLRQVFRTLPTTYRICHRWLSCQLRPGKRLVTEEPFSLRGQLRKPKRPMAVFSESADSLSRDKFLATPAIVFAAAAPEGGATPHFPGQPQSRASHSCGFRRLKAASQRTNSDFMSTIGYAAFKAATGRSFTANRFSRTAPRIAGRSHAKKGKERREP
jgi:hypothetical protein